MSRVKLNLLAFDFGSSSGRAILGKYNGRHIVLEEILRFVDGNQFVEGHHYWDIIKLYNQIIDGIRKANRITKNRISGIGIDTCGVDYGLLDKNNNLMGYPYFYRDHRTDSLMDEVFSIVPKEEIYQETGIQFMNCNTLIQLYSDLKKRPWILENAQSLLFLPDLLNFLLTTKKYSEYTVASTSQFFNPTKEEWAYNILKKLNLPKDIMQPIIHPGNEIGDLSDNVMKECSILTKVPVITVGSHDTASAIAGTPLEDRDRSVYISCGSWSLLGMEFTSPIINQQSMQYNFANELGIEKTVRFLTNISGLWFLDQCKRCWEKQGQEVSFQELSRLAAQKEANNFRIDINDEIFLNPTDPIKAIQDYCKKTNQNIPEDNIVVTRAIYDDLAHKYKYYIEKLEEITGKKIRNVNIVGGGSKSETLCKLVANITGRRVIAGPENATAYGNIIAQLIAKGEIKNLKEGREIIKKSINLQQYQSMKQIR